VTAAVTPLARAPDGPEFKDGWFARPDDCSDKHLFAQHIAVHVPVRSSGLVFGDDLDLDRSTFQLEYAALETGGGWPPFGSGASTRSRWFSAGLAGPGGSHVVFKVVAESEGDSGIFVSGPLPVAGNRPGSP
jgi:hypothetical protein